MDHRTRRVRDDAGFTLIELLVVMIIIGILSAIAVPIFLNQRKTAWSTAAAHDARQAAALVVAASDDTNVFPDATFRDDAAIAGLDAPLSEFKRSRDVGTAVQGIADGERGAGPAGFCIISYHDRARTWAMYDSATGPVARGWTSANRPAASSLDSTSPCHRLSSSWSTLQNAARGTP